MYIYKRKLSNMTFEFLYKEGIKVTISPDIFVFYDKVSRKVKLFRKQVLVDDFFVDEKYTVTEFLNYLTKLQDGTESSGSNQS